MKLPGITKEEFAQRIEQIQLALDKQGLDAMLVYGDEYRKENLRYVCDFWPIFERGACFIPKKGAPILAGAPEGEIYARSMCVWDDVRNIKEFACVSVPEEIEYPMANFSSLTEVISESLAGGNKLGVVGIYDMPGPIMERVSSAVAGTEIVDASAILNDLRLIKSPDEISCLRQAGRLACIGYAKLMEACQAGNTEVYAAGAGEGGARMAGAEDINFTVFGSGPRAETIIGRATNRIMEDGDMVMAALAVQYEGYVATVEYPFVIGKASDGQKRFLSALFEAANVQQGYLKAGVISGDMVRAVKAVFKKHGLEEYDVYPPMHGIGLAEAESPYPDTDSTYLLQENMCVNSDISLFGHRDGSNRIEESFVIDSDGAKSLTPAIREMVSAGI